MPATYHEYAGRANVAGFVLRQVENIPLLFHWLYNRITGRSTERIEYQWNMNNAYASKLIDQWESTFNSLTAKIEKLRNPHADHQ